MVFQRFFTTATLVLAFTLGLSSADAQQGAVKVFEQQEGPWKASCFRDPIEPAPYCRIMALKLIGPEGMAMNFAQFGPAWDRGQTGIVVATYLGFAKKSIVSLQIDDIEPWTVRAPDTNHVITPFDLTPIILKAMDEGDTMTLTFKPANGGKHTVSASLENYRTLLASISTVVSTKTQ